MNHLQESAVVAEKECRVLLVNESQAAIESYTCCLTEALKAGFVVDGVNSLSQASRYFQEYPAPDCIILD